MHLSFLRNPDVQFKLRHLFVPYVALSLAVVVGYSALNWFFVARLNTAGVDELFSDFGVPMVLSFGSAWLLLRRRVLVLKPLFGVAPLAIRSVARRRHRGPYVLVATAFILGPTALLQAYLTAAAGSVTAVQNLAEIARVEATKFYTGPPCLVREQASTFTRATDSAKYRSIHFQLFVVVPVCGGAGDVLGSPDVWVGYYYDLRISDSLSSSQQRAELAQLMRDSSASLAAEDLRSYRYFSRVASGFKRTGYLAALGRAAPPASPGAVLLEPHSVWFDDRGGGYGEVGVLLLLAGWLIWLLAVLVPDLHRDRHGAVAEYPF